MATPPKNKRKRLVHFPQMPIVSVFKAIRMAPTIIKRRLQTRPRTVVIPGPIIADILLLAGLYRDIMAKIPNQ